MLPNFIIVGAPKSGTTSLWHYCSEHPEIFMSPIKEPHFFSHNPRNFVLEDYENLFAGVKTEPVRGESSVTYFWCEGVPEKIKESIPQCKIIMILRNPAERLFSAFRHAKRKGRLSGNFEDIMLDSVVVGQSPDFFMDNILANSKKYSNRVKLFINLFGKDNVYVGLFHELKSDPLKFIKDVYSFLNVDDNFTPDIKQKYNIGGETKNNFIPRIVRHTGKFFRPFLSLFFKHHTLVSLRDRLLFFVTRFSKSSFSSEQRNLLIKFYKEDILELQSIIHKDLSPWLK